MRRRAGTLALLALLLPAAALACPVCSQSTEQNRRAFVGTTALLSFLPLGMIAGGLWWVRRNVGHLSSEVFEDRDAEPDARDSEPR